MTLGSLILGVLALLALVGVAIVALLFAGFVRELRAEPGSPPAPGKAPRKAPQAGPRPLVVFRATWSPGEPILWFVEHPNGPHRACSDGAFAWGFTVEAPTEAEARARVYPTPTSVPG